MRQLQLESMPGPDLVAENFSSTARHSGKTISSHIAGIREILKFRCCKLGDPETCHDKRHTIQIDLIASDYAITSPCSSSCACSPEILVENS